jgi:hypothetical protein
MLDLNPETVCYFISRAREFQAQEAVVIPEEPFSPSDDWALQTLAGHKDDFTYLEAEAVVEDLEPDQLVSLVALVWLGRGDFGMDEWETALEEAQESLGERTAEFLLATPLVADYLEEGLAQFGHSCEEEP